MGEKFINNVGAESEYSKFDEENFEAFKVGGTVDAKIDGKLLYDLVINDVSRGMNEIILEDKTVEGAEPSLYPVRYHDIIGITNAKKINS